MNPRKRRSPWPALALPMLIGLLSIIGLTSALIGDGWLDMLSWAGLGVPVLVTAWFLKEVVG